MFIENTFKNKHKHVLEKIESTYQHLQNKQLEKLKRYDILLRDIRNEIETLKTLGIFNALNFEEVTYIDTKD